MSLIGRRDLLILLIGSDKQEDYCGSVRGITRLQKYVFLLQEEGGLHLSGDDFEFSPYKAGPYCPKIYDDLELLENLGLIRTIASAESTEIESADIEKLSFDDLLDGVLKAPDSFEERKYTLTRKGKERVQRLLADSDTHSFSQEIHKVKSKFANYSLRDLLRYVYTKFPDMTTESEIIEHVIGRRRN